MTGIVQGWVNKDFQNCGVKVAWASQTLVDARFMWVFGSRKSDTPPVLLINYTPPPPPDTGEISASNGSAGSAGSTGSDEQAASLHLSNVKIKAVNKSSAYITWDTAAAANSYVEFGKTTDYGLTSGKDDSTKTHSVQLIELNANTVYHFRVESKDAAGASAASKDFTFRTEKDEKAAATVAQTEKNETRRLWIVMGALALLGLILVIVIVSLLISLHRRRKNPIN
jgi:hypothetical protein